MWRESYEGGGYGELFHLYDTGWFEGHTPRAVSVRVLYVAIHALIYSICLETSTGSGRPPLREWHMQVSRRPLSATEEEWQTLYTFSEAEISQRDIDAANYIVSMVHDTPFRDALVCCKRLVLTREEITRAGYSKNDAEEKEILDIVERRREMQWVRSWSVEGSKAVSRVGGKVVEEILLENEEARVKVLREKMGIAVEDSEAREIAGRAAALR